LNEYFGRLYPMGEYARHMTPTIPRNPSRILKRLFLGRPNTEVGILFDSSFFYLFNCAAERLFARASLQVLQSV
jgi:hypothetical protein